MGPVGCQDAKGRRLERAAPPFLPITLLPAVSIPMDGLHCVLPHRGQGGTPSTPQDLTHSKLLPEMEGASQVGPGLEADPQMPS